MSYKLELAICSCDTGQQMPCFDRCQLTITGISNIKEGCYEPRLHSLSTYQLQYGCHFARLCHHHHRCAQVPMINTTNHFYYEKSDSQVSMSMGLCLVALWATKAPQNKMQLVSINFRCTLGW